MTVRVETRLLHSGRVEIGGGKWYANVFITKADSISVGWNVLKVKLLTLFNPVSCPLASFPDVTGSEWERGYGALGLQVERGLLRTLDPSNCL